MKMLELSKDEEDVLKEALTDYTYKVAQTLMQVSPIKDKNNSEQAIEDFLANESKILISIISKLTKEAAPIDIESDESIN